MGGKIMDVHPAMHGRENAERVARENQHRLGLPYLMGDGDTAQDCECGAELVECPHDRVMSGSALTEQCPWYGAPAGTPRRLLRLAEDVG